MTDTTFNKYRAAIQILMQGRDTLVDALAEDVIAQQDDLLDGGFLFNEFLESQGTRLHFLGLLVAQLEQSADTFDEMVADEPPPLTSSEPLPPKKRRPRTKKVSQQASAEGKPDDA